MQNQERRASGVKRVPVQTLVEICGRVPEVPAFEAESIEVSGRGMHVKTRYLPPVGSPLVLRFEDRGRQILVEGEVSWAEPTDHGGEFGIRFTALDSGSVDALRELCAIAPATQASSPGAERAPEPPEAPERTRVPNGARVHLHIDGMGSTMKAQVRRSGGRKMTVGSKLELLKLGRHLNVEDVEAGERVGAVIETVDVLVDPQSQVPQLIVSLSYDEPYADATPEPSQVERGAVATVRAGKAPAGSTQISEADDLDAASLRSGFDPEDDDEPDFDTDDEEGVGAEFDDFDEDEEPSALKSKLGGAAASAGRIAKNTGEALKHVGSSAATRVGSWIKSRRQGTAPVKQTAAPPTLRRQGVPSRGAAPSSVYSDGRRLRPQSPRAGVEAPRTAAGRSVPPADPKRKLKRYGAIAGAAVMLGAVAVLAMRSPAADPSEAALSKGVSAETAIAPSDDVTQVDEQGDPITTGAAKGKTTSDGISADVPLFGPTPMATSEAAPVDDGEEGESLGAAEAVEDTPPVEDEGWDDQPAAKSPAEAKPAVVDPSKVPPWGRGKVTRPTIHRIRLDGPGGAIQGAINPTGFAVVIPNRKVMEDGAGIAKRDKRIARVRTSNAGGGAQVTFQFKDGIPGYRVRLRKDFVEFLISEPAKSGSLAKR
ncbi:MAG: PilZ domain-containing protein [Polyangiaceae bacterium]|nr:PilZ domain-containing protein [Polyangiaceae bacterium]MCW5792270.1 PilZ domain-containing protein [Polyangiaceae bacterium]